MKSISSLVLACVILIIPFVLAFGWVWNIVKMVGMEMPLTGMFILRVIGIFLAPLGGVLGYL